MTDIIETDEAPKYSSMMAVHHALHAQPVEFEKSINGMLADRIQNAVETHREKIAQSMFGNPNEEPEVEAVDDGEGEPEDTIEPELEAEPEAPVEEAEEEAPTEE